MSSGKSALGLDANVVAGLCYVGNLVCQLGLILSIITIVTDKTNKLARFHAFQSLFISVLAFVFFIVYWIIAFIGAVIDNALGFPLFSLVLLLVLVVIGIALLIGIVIAAIKAFQGEIYKLPVVGKYADQYSN